MKDQFGQLYVFEGMDRTGKTTLIHKVAERLNDEGYAVRVVTALGETSSMFGASLRALVVNRQDDIDVMTITLLIMAARRHLIRTVIRPALLRGEIVLLDRGSISTMALQGLVGGLGGEFVSELMKQTETYLIGDRVCYVQADSASRHSRIREFDDTLDDEFRQRETEVEDAFDFTIRQATDGAVLKVDNSNGMLDVAVDTVFTDVKNLHRFMNMASKPSIVLRT